MIGVSVKHKTKQKQGCWSRGTFYRVPLLFKLSDIEYTTLDEENMSDAECRVGEH